MIIEFFLNNPLFLLAVILLFFAIILLMILVAISKFLKEATGVASSINLKTLLVTVPKQKNKEENQAEKVEDLLAAAESWYANLGGIKSQRGLKSNFVGRDDHFCFEIVREKDGLISFYISVPENLHQFIEQQIHAKYPNAQITEVADFNAFDSHGYVVGASLKLKKHQMFPINTYKTIGSDPLDALTNSLSKLDNDESGIIQFVLRSARPDWHRAGSEVASEIQQGKSIKKAINKYNESPILKIWGMVCDYGFNRGLKHKTEEKNEYRLSPMEGEIVKALEQKTSKAGFDVNIRVIVCGRNKNTAENNLNNILNSFAQFTGYEYGNGFRVVRPIGKTFDAMIRKVIYRSFDEGNKFVLNTEEMISLYHFPLSITETPNIRWLLFKKMPPPSELPKEGVILGKSIYRGEEHDVYIKQADRRRHMYIIGSTGLVNRF